MGLTPLQVRFALMMRTTVLALVAVAAGVATGRLVSTNLISAVSKVYGLGAGIGRPPAVGTLAAAVVAGDRGGRAGRRSCHRGPPDSLSAVAFSGQGPAAGRVGSRASG